MLIIADVSALTIGKYLAYLAYGIVVPGTLIWRALRSRPHSFAEDLAGGTALGYALELAVYIPARAVGAPLLVAVWPALVIIAFLAVPGLRRHWRGKESEPAPIWWSWIVAAVLVIVFAALAVIYYRWHGLEWPWSSAAYFDTVFQLAVAAEAKNSVPPSAPYVLGEPLQYHWFVHAHMAASSWVTGIELQTILFRLLVLPMVAAFTVLIALIAQRISGKWWAGALAAVMTFLVSAFSPYRWTEGAFFDLSILELNIWVSPTQTFGAVLFAAVALLLVDRLRGEPGGRGEWVMIAILLAAVMGGKATFLPLLLFGLGVLGLVELITLRKIRIPTLTAAAITFVLFLFATFVLFGGSSQALIFKPLLTVRMFGAMRLTELTTGYATKPPHWLTLLIACLALFSWGVRSIGATSLFTKRSRLLDPPVLVLAGFCLIGAVMTLVMAHPGISQSYFLRSVSPYLGVLSACGIAALVPAERSTRRVAAALVGAGVAGGLLSWGVARLDNPLAPRGGRDVVVIELFKPILAVAAVLLVAAGALYLARRRFTWFRGITLALIVCAMTGLGLAPSGERLVGIAEAQATTSRYIPVAPGDQPMPKGGIEAARWLRAHSEPRDILATNTHCRKVVKESCDNRHFWIAGYAERRVLIEGWGYTPAIMAQAWSGKGAYFFLDYWDPQRLADNDRAFQQPSAEAIATLREKYGVRWLFVDERYDKPASTLGDFAEERYRSGDVTVYELATPR